MSQDNPYAGQPQSAFWRTAVAEPGVFGYENLWNCPFQLPQNARFSTYGSCFAQYISRALKVRGQPWVDAEPAPAKSPAWLRRKYNYSVFSSRTANIYTAKALETWVSLALDPARAENIEFWEQDGRFFDSLRPAIEPEGFSSTAECLAMLQGTVQAFRRSITDCEVFVFTMGLTEGFENADTGQPYAICPGTLAGRFDPDRHLFVNYGFLENLSFMQAAIEGMKKLNPRIKVILTVSPVPLTATAGEDHVLVATTHSKSTLRAVAGELAASDPIVAYFPSYEIISGHPAKAQFFEPNMRTVSRQGVSLVMEHFFAGLDLGGKKVAIGPDPRALFKEQIRADEHAEALACEEQVLEALNAN